MSSNELYIEVLNNDINQSMQFELTYQAIIDSS